MEEIKSTNEFKPIFPALTTAQRCHLEVYGYVVIERLLTDDQVSRLLEALQKLSRGFFATSDPYCARIRNCTIGGPRMAYAGPRVHFFNIIETYLAILDYLAHPRIVDMAEEAAGTDVLLEESQVIINSSDPQADPNRASRYLWHHIRPSLLSFTENGLLHSVQAKALTNLTDLGPDDGGIVVIAGSHKLSCAEEDLIATTREDSSLIYQVIAPAGPPLLFYETLLHSIGAIHSDRERTAIIGGYSPSMLRFSCNPSLGFLGGLSVSDPLKTFHLGRNDGWSTRRKRTLDIPMGVGHATDPNPRMHR